MTYKIAELAAYSFLFSILLSPSHSCPTGYLGSPCQVRHCESLVAPPNGVIKGGRCSTHYSSVCKMDCNEGYEPLGCKERLCIVHREYNSMVWSGYPLQCAVIRCPRIMAVQNADPPFGECTIPSLDYKSRCSFKCRTGYRLKGSKERVCQLDKSWSGSPTICERISCPKLQPVQIWVAVTPAVCATGPVPAFSACHVRCPSGYTIQGHPPTRPGRTLVCQLNGTWTESIPTCRDFAPPKLSCPYDVQTTSAKGKATAKVSWSIQVTDNSVEVDPNAAIRVRSSHESGQELPIGITLIRVNATDDAGNIGACAFTVHVRDTEPPSCSFCPADVVQEVTTSEVRVYWKTPNCSDNSGISPTLQSNRQIGDLFNVPSTSLVQYIVSDGPNVNNNCSFIVTLTVKSCTMFPPPRNGALACRTVYNDVVCSAFCKNGTDFEFNPPLVYYCSGAEWKYWPFPNIVQVQNAHWPNCSGSANPSWIKEQGHHWLYYSGDAHDPSVQEVIKSQFYGLLTSNIVPSAFCSPPQCDKDSFTVSPGAIGDYSLLYCS